ncbi:thioredoxin domain-containing protein [Streptacidiphilus sp. P02-A3a]|uniref:DsbA family protein n=1 Tax=Streptacidiphilus sp. P02-A3a TaxID=2704468 RepID=UPI0015FB01E9|nr:thioredoxin domain-containing protein [Streptacidiphilus sp. P02-A3a]QMU68604.1 thioredoxin domain-containing protein [Streptacidiphilus sp. P02-A3a]
MVALHRAQVVRIAVAVAALAAAVGAEARVDRALAEGGVQRAAFSVPVVAHRHPVRPLLARTTGRVTAHRGEVVDVPQRQLLLGLPAALGADGSAVEVGYPDAPDVLTLFEDFRCSTTRAFEGAQGPALAAMAASHQVLIRYVLESSLDERLPGPGALLATNAARAALAHGGFPLYHALLFANQPPEDTDGFTQQRLLELASAVPGLRGAAFDDEVRSVAYRQWVGQAQQAYNDAGVHFGTPSMLLNGNEVDLGTHPQLLTAPSALQSFVRDAAERG